MSGLAPPAAARSDTLMTRRFQFSLRALLVATLLAAIGLWFLGQAERVTWWQFAFLVSSGFATFGAAVGVVLGKTAKWTAYGIGAGLLLTLYAIIC